MGYETKLFIGSIRLSLIPGGDNEVQVDKDHPYEDGSGFPYKKNADGTYVYTGRTEKWLQVFATLDLCKIGEGGPLVELLYSIPRLSYKECKEFVYVFDTDGNSRIIEDKYGEIMKCFPLTTFLDALNKQMEDTDGCYYRRFKWCKALLESMKDDGEIEDLFVLTYGH